MECLLLLEKNYPEPDEAPYEKPYKRQLSAVFPYDLKKMQAESGVGLIASTPYGNTLMADFAIATIEGEKLGMNLVPDMLTVSFSSPDYIGHQVGAQSREIHDIYLRLDLELQRFFKYLDKKFGMGNVIIFLTADHGAADIPAYVKSNTGYYSESKIKAQFNRALEKEFGFAGIIENISNLQIFMNHAIVDKNKIDLKRLLEICKRNIDSLQGIYDVMLAADLGQCAWVKRECELMRNGYNPRRSGDLILASQPGWIGEGYIQGGTTHGSPFTYDTHVPLLWLGWRIRKGISYQRTEIPDIAPTLALLLGCTAPNGASGNPIYTLLEK